MSTIQSQKNTWRYGSALKIIIEVCAVMVFVTGFVWTITQADILQVQERGEEKNFSAIGIISAIEGTSFTITDAKNGKGDDHLTYTFDSQFAEKIETNKYEPISLAQMSVGGKVIVQGKDKDGAIVVNRIIYFGTVQEPSLVDEHATSTDSLAASSTATSTDTGADTSTATTTETAATSTDTDSGDGATTPADVPPAADANGTITSSSTEHTTPVDPAPAVSEPTPAPTPTETPAADPAPAPAADPAPTPTPAN